ncbi:hypothetical protein EPO15_18085, partial [bacterium]
MIVAVVGSDTKLCLQYQALLQSQGHHVTLLADATKAPARLEAMGAHLVVLAGLGPKDAHVGLLHALRAGEIGRA